jgi:hypothetical protein
MILNSYALLLGFIALLRLASSLLVLGIARPGRHALAQGQTPEERTALENRCYLLFLLALLLAALNLASWPLLYLLLQSYVAEWPGVMCIYGVTQIGKGSLGPSRLLPDLLHFLQLAKPALVFLSGAWAILYLLNRWTTTAPLLNRLVIFLVPLAALAAADAVAELAYLAIPKKEVFPSAGCCTGALVQDETSRFVPPILLSPAGRAGLTGAYYGGNVVLLLALLAASRRLRTAPPGTGLWLLLLCDAALLIIGGVFLVEVAAPLLLRLPDHHCAYDLIPQAPEAIVPIVLFVAGSFLVGWAGVARWLGRSRETEPFVPEAVRRLLRLSLWAYSMSLAMLSLELMLA